MEKERKLQTKIINNLMSSNYPMKTLERVWKLIKGEWQM